MLYGSVREIRESGTGTERLPEIWRTLHAEYPEDWLLPLEILEVLAARSLQPEVQAEIRSSLESRAATEPALAKLIASGLRLLEKS